MIAPNEAIAADLEQTKDHVQNILGSIEALGMEFYRGPEDAEAKNAWEIAGDREESELSDALQYHLDSLATRMAMYADALNFREGLRLIQNWRNTWPLAKLKETTSYNTSEDHGVESRAYSELLRILYPLLVLTKPSDSPPIPDEGHRLGHETLQYALKSMAKLCRDRGVIPKKEADVQSVMHSHLSGIFPDYTHNFTIPKPLLSFRPDGGVPSLKSAIECKFIDSDQEIRTALHGLTEDLSGYSGSNDWDRFYSLCYMTQPFAVEGQLSKALGMSGNAGSWSILVVTGNGLRVPRRRAAKSSEKAPAP